MTTSARELSSRLADLLRREHHALAEFLLALAAFDRERRWSDLGYNSLFSFLVRELDLSKGAAYYRQTAAELVERYPEVLEALRLGKLCLTSIVELSKVISPENQAEILPRFFHLSKREAREVIAELVPNPAPPLRTVVTAAVTDVGSALGLAPSAAPAGAERPGLPEVSVGQPTTPMPTPSGSVGVFEPARARTQRTEVEPLSGDLRRMHVTVSRRLLEKLARARDALSHAKPGATDDEILQLGLDLILERQAKQRGLVKSPRSAAPSAAEPSAPAAPSSAPAEDVRWSRSRYIPAEVRRAVWGRDRGCCQWKLDGGGICGSTVRVEIDHVEGWARGAGNAVEELRLLCRVHQDVSARQLYGDVLMDRYTRRKGGACSETVASYGPQCCSATSPRSSS